MTSLNIKRRNKKNHVLDWLATSNSYTIIAGWVLFEMEKV
jgi:hypothetical protein